MRAAESGKKIIKRHFIGEVLHAEFQGKARTGLFVEQIVGADSDIVEAVRLDAIGIVIVILSSRLRQR